MRDRGEWILDEFVSDYEQVGVIVPSNEYRVCIEDVE